MNAEITFGQIVKARRRELGLTQDELAHRVGCAPVTLRKIEYDDLRPSVQIAERLAMALGIPLEERAAFVRLARVERAQFVEPPPTPPPALEEIGIEDLSGRGIRGYALGDRIGNGGFGVVYRATQPLVEREVAIKIILPKYANHPEFIRRFEAEAQLVARLEHPHIVPLYDYWREPNVAYLVMRLLRGGSVQSLLQSGPLQPDLTLRILEQIGSALGAAHRAGVIHRDLKPANVLLDDDRNAYLADFGIAKNLSSPLPAETQVDAIIGTPDYISPEQIRSEFVRPQTDIYCLGVMMYELLTGTVPFRGPTPIEIMHQHLSAPMPPLAASRSGLPKALDHVIERATAKDPFERYENVENLIADFRRAIGVDWRVSTGESTTIVAPVTVTLTAADNPYKGLRAFNEFDAADFFGRETLTQRLLARLGEGGDLARFLAVAGPSGSGKSSVVKAGLIPALRRGGLPGSENWFIVEMMPGTNPFEELEAALLRVAVNPPSSLLEQLRAAKRGLLRAANRCLPDDSAVELVLVIDQFEELFTLVLDEALRVHFLDSLVTAALDERSRVRIVITLRADFVDRPLNYVDFGDLIRQRTEFVLPLTPDELERAIVSPAERVGLQMEAGVVSAIVHDIGEQPGTLPLLQYALTELFEKREGNTITKTAYQSIGGVLGALGRRAEEVFVGLDESSQNATRQSFLRLVTLGEGVEDTRRRVLRSELESLISQEHREIGRHSKDVESVLDAFGRSRLLTFDRDPLTRGPTVEVAHEALLREWSRLREWLNESRGEVRLQRQLAHAASEWQTDNRDTSYLLTGARLAQFEGWVATSAVALTQDERAFLQASIEERERREVDEVERQRRELEAMQKLAETESRRAQEQVRAARNLRRLAVGLAIFLAVAIGAAWFAQDNFVTAERIRLASQAQIALDNGEGGDLPALLAMRSLLLGYSPEADAAFLNALRRGFTRQIYIGHSDAIYDIDFSPDGHFVATASLDATARLWDVQTGQELRRFAPPVRIVHAVEFSPDGQYLVTGSPGTDGARLWDVQTGQEVRKFTGHNGGPWEIKFSPDGQYLLTGDDRVAHLWDVATGKEIRQFTGHTGAVTGVAFSPDGQAIATGDIVDGTVRLWDLATGEELRQFTHDTGVNYVAFSPDGQSLFTVSGNIAQLWNIKTGLETQRFVGHTDWTTWGDFSPDGRYLVTSSHDKTARLWDVATGQELRQFIGHTGPVFPVAFSPEGQYLLTGSDDRTARLWDVQTSGEPHRIRTVGEESGAASGAQATALSADGKYVLNFIAGEERGAGVTVWNTQTGGKRDLKLEVETVIFTISAFAFSSDNDYVLGGGDHGDIWLWDAQTGKALYQSKQRTAPVRSVTFSPDGRLLLTGGDDKTARVWDAPTGKELLQFIGHTAPLRSVAFSSDSQFIVTGSDDKTARMWNAKTGQELHQFLGHTGAVRAVAFSPDGKYLLTASEDRTARLWDTQTGTELRQFVGHTAQVSQVAFSPDGQYVLTGSADQTARLWDVDTGTQLRQFAGHLSPVLYVGFSENGRSVITGDTQSAIVWRTALEDVVAFTCAQLKRDLTTEERVLYHIRDNAPTCSL